MEEFMEEFFDKAGLVTTKNDGIGDKYYKRKGEKSDKYGYRLPFEWEKINEYSYKEVPPGEKHKYVLRPGDKVKDICY